MCLTIGQSVGVRDRRRRMVSGDEIDPQAVGRAKWFGYRASREWKALVPSVIFMALVSAIGASLGLIFMAVSGGLGALALSFVAGYLMRADETATGHRPHLPFLYVAGQDERAPRGAHHPDG